MKISKNYILFIFILFITLFSLSSLSAHESVNEIYIRPKLSVLYPVSSNLRAYYNRDMIIMYGGELDLDPGIYIQVLKYKFQVNDPYESISISSIWFTIGVEKNFKLFDRAFYGRLGLTYHSDELLLTGSKPFRIGIQTVLGYNVQLLQNMQLFFEIGYEFETIKQGKYLTESLYDRHQYYFYDRRFQTGGVFITMGWGFRIFKGND